MTKKHCNTSPAHEYIFIFHVAKREGVTNENQITNAPVQIDGRVKLDYNIGNKIKTYGRTFRFKFIPMATSATVYIRS